MYPVERVSTCTIQIPSEICTHSSLRLTPQAALVNDWLRHLPVRKQACPLDLRALGVFEDNGNDEDVAAADVSMQELEPRGGRNLGVS